MAKGENFYGEMEIGADVRPKQKIDVKRIKKARNTRNNSVFDENKTFDSNAAIKEAGKRKSKKIRKKKVESEKFEALKQDKVDEPEQTMPKNVTAQELQWWKERRGVIKLKPDDTMGELPEIKKGDDSVQVEAEGNDIESLRKKELELVEKIQRLPKSHPKQPLSEEKKDILDKLEKNRKAQQRIIAEARQIETEPKEAIKTGGHTADSPEITKSVTQEELPVRQDKHRSKVFQQQYFDDKYVDNLEARQEMEELAKQPSPELKQEFLEKNEEYINAKEEQEIGDKDKKIIVKGEEINAVIDKNIDLAKENAKLRESIENLESKLAAMEAEIEKARKEYGINEVEAKNKTTIEKLKDFVDKNPKLTTMIALGVLGGFGVGALGTTPLYFLAKEIILATTGKTIFVSAMGGLSTPLYLAAGGGALHWFSEKIGLIKNKKGAKEILEELLENKKQPSSEPPIETPAKETEDIKDKTRKDDKIDVIEGSGSEELTLEEKEKMRKIAKGNKIDIISPGAEVKDDGELIKKTERMKKPVPETEDKFNKKAEDVRTFIGQLKEGKKTGKEIFEYLENLRHHFLYSSKVNFNSKIKPEFDKLSREEKTDTIDLTVEYFMSQEQHKGEFLRRPFIFDLDDIIYGKDFSEFDYVVSGKPKNVEWLQGNKS